MNTKENINPELEKHEIRLLAGMVYDPHFRMGKIDSLSSNSFHIINHKIIFGIIDEMKDRPFNDIFFTINNSKELTKDWNYHYFEQLLDTEGSYCSNSEIHFEEVKRFERYMAVKTLFNAIDPLNPKESQISALLEVVEQNKEIEKEENSIKNGLIAVARELMTNDREPSLMTGFKEFDFLIDGMRKGVYLMCGRPGMGKTTFAFQVAFETSKHNPDIEVLFFSLEMSLRDCNYKTFYVNV